MSTETTWQTRLSDRLRELLLPAVTITIVSSIWILGHVHAREDELLERFATPIYVPAPTEHSTADDDELDDPEADRLPIDLHGLSASADAPSTTRPIRERAFTSIAE